MNILKVLTEKRKLGNLGEDAAVKFLKKEGYKILRRNFIGDDGEIDIIALKDDTVIFIEVKTRDIGRKSFIPRPAASVDPEKQRRIIAASRSYRDKVIYGKRQRFDVIEVYTEALNGAEEVKQIKHLVNAFDLDSAYKGYKKRW